jgi:hypothetical protein
MATRSRQAAILAGMVLAGCSAVADRGGAPSASHLNFLDFADQTYGLVGRVKQSSLSVCLSGVSEDDAGTWGDNIKSVVAKWVEPLRSLTGDTLVSDVEVSTTGGDCDANVVVAPDTWSNTQIGDSPTVNMSDQGYFASYNVLLHEFGHAFALADTYVAGGVSGDCQPGQPEAVMCNTSFAELQPDDLDGLRDIFTQAFPDDQPADGKQPSDGKDPVQPFTKQPPIPPGTAIQLFAALGAGFGGDRYPLTLALTGVADGGAAAMAVCMNDSVTCGDSDDSAWQTLAISGQRSGVLLFSLPNPVQLTDGMQISVRYRTPSGDVVQALEFDRQ